MFITQLLSNPAGAILYLVAIVIAVSLHEYAHAYAADKLGDPTPSLQGRLTPNPRAHLDLYGSILFLLVGFGWGKPVQFDPFNLRHPHRDAAVISLAGPVTNIALATLSAILLRILILAPVNPASLATTITTIALQLLFNLVQINIVLAVFNLVPIHPLDGFKVIGGLLSEKHAREWYQLQPYGIFFLVILMFFPLQGVSYLQHIIGLPINFFRDILLPHTPLI